MVGLTIVFGILLFLTVDMLVQRRQLQYARDEVVRTRPVSEESSSPRPPSVADVPQGYGISPDHAWVRLEPQGTWRVGADPLLCALLGSPQFVELPPPGTWLRRGEPLATLQRGRRRLVVPSPVRGCVVESNLRVSELPGALRSDPYDRGWLCRVERKDEYSGGSAVQLFRGRESAAFMAREIRRLRDALSNLAPHPTLGPALADGGAPSPDLARELDDATWKRLIENFLGRDAGGTS